MSEGAATAFLERQTRLSTVQGLDLALLIDTKDQAPVRWIQVKANHVGQFFQKLYVPREFETARSVGLKIILLPHAIDGARADLLCSRHRPTTPVSRTFGLGLQGGCHYGGHFALIVSGLATTTGLNLPYPIQSLRLEASPP